MSASIIATDLSVKIPIFGESGRNLKSQVLNAVTGGKVAASAKNDPIITALDSISLEIFEGDRVGLTGSNGSGKTTLLRVFSGIYAPTAGSLRIKGKVASLLDVSMGLDQEATGYENIYLRGILEGLRPGQIRHKTEAIAEFSGLGDYLNFPIRTYSSGMRMRLAFAISTSVEADILIMDEWLSTGDADFSAQATARLEEIIDQSSILVLASHNYELINQVCTRHVTLSQGSIVSSTAIQRKDPGATAPKA